MASRSTTNSEPLVPSRSELLQTLLSDDVDPTELASRFLQSDSLSWGTRERLVVEFLFYSGGCYNFAYDHYLQSSRYVVKLLKNKSPPPLDLPSLDDSFMARLDAFLRGVLSSFDLNEESMNFIDGLTKAVRFMIKGVWNSMRRVASCTGLVLMSYCLLAIGKLAERQSAPNVDQDVSRFYGNWSSRLATKWDYLTERFFDLAYRDKASYIRETVFKEMEAWAKVIPRAFLEPWWTEAIVFGLCDCPEWILQVLKHLYETDLNSRSQLILFKKIRSALVKILSSKSDWAVMAMEILSSASRDSSDRQEAVKSLLMTLLNSPPFCNRVVTSVAPTTSSSEGVLLNRRYLDQVGSEEQEHIIYMCVYNENYYVGVGAANYLLNTVIRDKRTGPVAPLLLDLAIFNHEAKIQSAELVMDSFFHLLKERVSWEDWGNLFEGSPPEYIVRCVELFFSYVRKAVTDFCPKGRTRTDQRLSKRDMDAACHRFTSFMSTSWKTLLRNEKVQMNSACQAIIIQSMTFCNKSLSSSIAVEIVTFLGELLKFKEDSRLIDACWSTMSFLKNTVVGDSLLARPHLESVLASLTDGITRQFLEYVAFPSAYPQPNTLGARMIGLAKHGHLIATTEVWDICCERLGRLLGTSSNTSTPDLTHAQSVEVSLMLEVLYYLVFHYVNALYSQSDPDQSSDDRNEDLQENSPDLDESCSTLGSTSPSQLPVRASKLTNWALATIGFKGYIDLRFLACSILWNMVTFFGPQMAYHPNTELLIMSSSVDPRVETAILSFACEVMASPTPNAAEKGICCTVLKNICELLSCCLIKIEGISKLLSLTAKCAPEAHRHSDIVIKTLREYSDRFPQRNCTISFCIARAIGDLINFTYLKEAVAENSGGTWNLALKNVKVALDKWSENSDFRRVMRVRGVLLVVQRLVFGMSERLQRPDLHALVIADEFTRTLSSQETHSTARPTSTEMDAHSRHETTTPASSSSPVILTDDDYASDFSAFGRTPIGHSTMYGPQQLNSQSRSDSESTPR